MRLHLPCLLAASAPTHASFARAEAPWSVAPPPAPPYAASLSAPTRPFDEPQSPGLMATGIVLTSLGITGAGVGTSFVLYGQVLMRCTHEGEVGCPEQDIAAFTGLLIAAVSTAPAILGVPLWVFGQHPQAESSPSTVQLELGAGSADLALTF